MGKLSALLLLALALLAHPVRAQETDIDRAVDEARQDTSRLHTLYDAVLNALVYVPTAPAPAPAAQGDTARSGPPGAFYPLVTRCAGVPCVIAFDRRERLAAWGSPETKYAAVAASSLVQSMAEGGSSLVLSLNPGTPFAYIFQPDELALMLAGLQSHTAPLQVASGTEVFMGAPAADVPASLLRALTSALAAQPGVSEAYLSQFTMGEGNSGLLLVLKLDDTARERFVAISDAVQAAVQDVLPQGSVMSVTLYTRHGMNQHVGQTGRLVYRRAELE